MTRIRNLRRPPAVREVDVRRAETRARDLMKSPVRMLDSETSLRDSASILSEHQISGAPVTDRAGKPVGVVSLHDIVTHLAGLDRPVGHPGGFYAHDFPKIGESDDPWEEGGTLEEADLLNEAKAADIMTPEIISVSPTATVPEIAATMLKRKIHRVFVSEGGVLLGVISSMDLLRVLAGAGAPAPQKS